MEKETAIPSGRLAGLGVYGFDRIEPVILAALVTEDPLLLIGRSGTGKTFLLNSLSETLGLEHRHYNASLISFDDLVGFPYPDEEKAAVRFLETPATVWNAESVLIDEISRCKPEHQNRLFSLVHERRIQGMALARLRFRWAAMNPCSPDQRAGEGEESYLGSEPLDPALADRFALIVPVGDWDALSPTERLKVADPAGEGARSGDGGQLRRELEGWRAAFLERAESCPTEVVHYATAAVSAFLEAGVRLSPRRSRLLCRSLLAASVVCGGVEETLFRNVLECSLPQRAWGEEPAKEVVAAAHRLAWDSAMLIGRKKWVHDFHLENNLARKAALLFDCCPDADTASMAVAQALSREKKERAAAFAFTLYPAAIAGHLKIGAEGVQDLARLAGEVLSISTEISWQERISDKNTSHPELVRIQRLLDGLEGARQERARQLLYWCVANKIVPASPEQLEADLQACVEAVRERIS
jgi:MoxR-like ATPase